MMTYYIIVTKCFLTAAAQDGDEQVFCFSQFIEETENAGTQCAGDFLDMVTVSECCTTLNGGGYVQGSSSEECISCMTFTGKLMLKKTSAKL